MGLVSPTTPEADPHARYSLAIGGGPRSALEPSRTIPAPPATIDVPPNATVTAAIKAVPNQVPFGHLSRELLESPLRDPARFERCRIPRTTRVDINALIYNGQAIGVDVFTKPGDRALNFCIERVVRETSWVKELAVNRVSVSL
jgi:hypothetical protein